MSIAAFAASASLAAAATPSVESRDAFLKIVAEAPPVDAQAELNPPLLLYLRKSCVLSISLTFAPRSAGFDVAISTWVPDGAARAGGGGSPAQDGQRTSGYHTSGDTGAGAARTYTYRFTNEATAATFCEALISNQGG